MNELELQTTSLHRLIDGIQGGDPRANEELVRRVCSRLEVLARKMLRGFPGVARFEQTDDVLAAALLRLLRTLNSRRPASMREFYGLAANHIRSELIDLLRHYQGPRGIGTHEVPLTLTAGAGRPIAEPVAPDADPGELEKWQAFHEAVEQLPAEEREVTGLVFYHGWKQAQVAELFGVSERTIGRCWKSACLKLRKMLSDDLPPL